MAASETSISTARALFGRLRLASTSMNPDLLLTDGSTGASLIWANDAVPPEDERTIGCRHSFIRISVRDNGRLRLPAEDTMRFLLIESDVQIGQKLFRTLRDDSYTVDWIRNGTDAGAAIASTNYAAILLDLCLVDITGIDLLKTVRMTGNPVPVLTMASCDDIDARIGSLDAGADDCLTRTMNGTELLARVRAVLRRRAGYATSRIGNESLSLDLETRTLQQDGVTSPLSAREFALMHSFMERPGSILSRSQLEDRIYGWGREVESNAIDVLIHTMRKKFGQSLIRNVRGMGWMVAHSVDARAASTSLRH